MRTPRTAVLLKKLIRQDLLLEALPPAVRRAVPTCISPFTNLEVSPSPRQKPLAPPGWVAGGNGGLPFAAAQLLHCRGASRKSAAQRLARTSERATALARTTQPHQAGLPTAVVPAERPASEQQVANVVSHQALVVSRPVEWGTVLLGYEQANRYTVYDERGAVVAQLIEEEGSVGRAVGRQLLLTRRPFAATVLSPDGAQVIFRLRRPFYLISSTIYVEDGSGEVVGEVQQRWHPWRRPYDLFLGNRQFAAVDAGFLAWEFELKDEQGGTLALIDRNFAGFGRELFTDAGKYVIHFGSPAPDAAKQLQTAIAAAHPGQPPPPVTALARARTDVQVIPTSSGNQLTVHRPLSLDERMVALAAAISIDYDYFSSHSYGGGALSPFVHPPIIPFPMPGMGGGGGGEAVEGAGGEGGEGAAAAGGSPAAGGAAEAPGGGGSSGEPLERDLGGDEWDGGGQGTSGGDLWGGDDDGGGDEGSGSGLSDLLGGVFGWGDDS